MFKRKSRKLALILLLSSGSFVVLLGIAVLGLGLTITHSDAFHDTVEMKAEVEPGIDYVQFWIGLPYIITGVSVACSAVNLRRVSLTVCTITLSVICIVLSLAGLVVDGPDFAKWKNLRASQRYWERRDGYACSTKDNICSCRNIQKPQQNITSFTDCETLMDLSSLYGLLISCFIFVLVVLFAAAIMIVYIITTKEAKTRRSSSKNRRTLGNVIEVTESRQPFEEPVAGPSPNPRDEQPKERTQAPYREHNRKEVDSVSQHDTGENGVANDGMVMMDPGHFQLGDDDIY